MDDYTALCDTVKYGYQCKPKISHFWGQYSPWFEVESKISNSVPHNCEVTFAQVLSRHGARFPTTNRSNTYNGTIEELRQNVTSFKGKYAFIEDYIYQLGAEDLTAFGEQEMINSGILFKRRYHALAKQHIPFVRAASQERVVASAQNFVLGYQEVDQNSTDIPILIVTEAPRFNNTLSHDTCTNFLNPPISKIGGTSQSDFAETFVPKIRDRLNSDLPGAQLTKEKTIQLMDLCPFNTVASPDGNHISPFCYLFNKDEWHAYSYYQTLGKYYGFGPGNPLAPTQGVGYVNELIARLTDTPVNDHTNTNSTLDGNPKTFPLGRKLYADFSHDNDMENIFSALGLWNKTKPLSNTTITEASDKRAAGFSAAWSVPFAARAYFEKLKCKGSDEEHVRILLNGRVVPLVGCGADHRGMCKLSAFVKSQSFSSDGGLWNQCYN